MLLRIVSLLAHLAAARAAFHIDLDTNLIVDELGRARVFHGVNAVEKLGSFLPSSGAFDLARSLGRDDAALLRGWGLNVVRLGVMWPATMPAEGVVNATYLSLAREMIEALAEFGVATIVDLHQDVLSPYTCGEGVPDWAYRRALDAVGFNRSDAARAFPAPRRVDVPTDPATGHADAAACAEHAFFGYYFTYESEAAWHALYAAPAVQDLVGDHWEAVARALAGARGLLGYEMLNEPFPARPADGSARALSDAATLLPLYERLHARVRAADDAALFFFEPLVLEEYEAVLARRATTDFPPGGPGGPAYANRSVFAYHSYCANDASGAPAPWRLCEAIVASDWRAFAADRAALGVGGFLTEFGAVGPDATSLALLRLQAERAEAQFQGWAYWTYKSFDDITTQNPATETLWHANGTLQDGKVRELARTYAQAIAGAPTATRFNATSAAFSLSFASRAAIAGDTLVYLSTQYYYPRGFDVALSPAAGVAWSTDAAGDGWAVLRVAHDRAVVADGDEVSIVITAK